MSNNKRIIVLAVVFMLFITVSYAAVQSWNTVLPAFRVRKDVATGTSGSNNYSKAAIDILSPSTYTTIRARIWCQQLGSWATAQHLLTRSDGMASLSFYDSSYKNKNMTLAVSNNTYTTDAVTAQGRVNFNP